MIYDFTKQLHGMKVNEILQKHNSWEHIDCFFFFFTVLALAFLIGWYYYPGPYESYTEINVNPTGKEL